MPMTHYDVLSFVIQAFEFHFTVKPLDSHLCYFSFEHKFFYLFSTYYFFDNITLICINLPNVTLSNMSHLVYITLLCETDGVTISRLECRLIIQPSRFELTTLIRAPNRGV